MLNLKDVRGEFRLTPARVIRASISKPIALLQLLGFAVMNRFSNSKVVGSQPVVVSLTTFGSRLNTVFATVESIGRGEIRPERVILWLDGSVRNVDLPRSLKRLQNRGLEIIGSENSFGPHTKYYPYAASMARHTRPLVTADDDLLYDRLWLKRLSNAYREDGESSIICYRAHRIRLANRQIQPYLVWPPVTDTKSSPRVFATGVSGVIYPPRFLEVLREAGTAFEQSCPRADDIWLHAMAVRNNVSVRQLDHSAISFTSIPFTQRKNLVASNVGSGENDAQIRSTYNADDIAAMQADRRDD